MKKLLVILCILILPVCSFASEKPVWVEATGEACLGEIDTPKEVKERARRDAQKNALEKAVGVFIKSHTLVSNSQLAEDLIYAAVRGQIEKSEILHEGWDTKERSLYRIKLKSLIKPVYPEKGKGLSVKAYLSKTDLKEGEEVRIFYEASNDCYIYIFSVAADGSVTLLLPNSIHMENLTRTGKAYEFPTSDSEIHLKAMFLPGYKGKVAEERIKLIATKEKEEILSLGFHEGMFKVYDSRSTGMISDLVKRLNRIDPDKWTETTAVYTLTR
ncbi:MAG TPA: DUF4384 domain-containing protein [Anaerolineae bacterium]|nr:DUF4384 domain-containing protein [Anaerolineae bacterium]